ncbi:MAG: CvpA family protein [Proteobacteria bacterium]|nr:CvpA family protein [Pseudomonadota bacterium]MDA0993938.1 CvpA family protein [Pseudomonadota bacterium]
MPIVDIIIILATLVSVVIGWFRGLIKEAIAIVSLLVAIWAAMHLGPYAGGWLGGNIDSTELQLWAGRFLIFVVILALGALVGWGISKIVHLSGLSGTDRALGGFFGLVRSILLVGVFVLGGRYAGADANLWWRESKLIPYGEHVADWIIVMAPRGIEMLDPSNMPHEFRLKIPNVN